MMLKSKLFSILGLTLAISAAAFAGDDAKTTSAKVGEKAPAFVLKDLNGTEHNSKDLAGKIIVLEWVNPGCPVCKGAHMDGRIPSMVKELSAAMARS